MWLRRRLLPVLAYASLVFLLAQTGYWAYWRLTGNFHQVVAGEFYRAGQLSQQHLGQIVHDYGIRSIINLRGKDLQQDWYNHERQITDSAYLDYYDFGMSPKHILPPDRVAQLIKLLQEAPKPVLIHCREGADRTGLAAALYLAEIKHVNADEAYNQLSWQYGHFPYLNSETEEMDDTYWQTVDPDGDHETVLSWE
jgi:protein tyrosine/serine phosphatase